MLSCQFLTAKLAFIVTVFIYQVINPINTRAFRLKLPRGAQSGTPLRKSPLITKNFASNLLSQGSIEEDYLSKNLKNLSFADLINFNTEFQY